MFRHNYPSRKYNPLKILFFGVVFIILAAAMSAVVMLLWNAILPEVAGVKPLTFWKAAGLLLLAKILFSGFGGRRFGRKRSKPNHWRNKWMQMSSEERHEAKSRWKAYCNRKDSSEQSQEE